MIIPVIRPGDAADLNAIAAIQSASPEAAQWEPAGYLAHGLRVAAWEGTLAGFLAWRELGAGDAAAECEILNLAVSPDFRRRGIGRALVESLLAGFSGTVFLEVRAGNAKALQLYESLGFRKVGERPEYYQNPQEAAIVMKFHSC